MLATAAAGPVLAKLSDIWGRKLLLLACVAVFAASSAMAAASKTMTTLIAARAIQGTAAGGLEQLVSITIADVFSMRERALYFGGMGVMWVVAGAAGPLVGGAFTQLASWRWCFWVNLPISALAFIALFFALDVHNPRTRLGAGLAAVDWYGTVSVLAVTLLILLGLDFGGVIFPWNSPKVICLLVFGVLAILLFFFSETRLAKYPLMPMSVFRKLSNNAAFLVAITHSMVLIGGEYYLPLYFQSVKESSPLRSGVYLLPLQLTASIGELAAGVFTHQTGRYRELMWVGSVIMTVGTGMFIYVGVSTPIPQALGFQAIMAAGFSMMFHPPNLAILNSVSQADTATATATLGSLRNFGTALSIVLGGVVFQNGMAARHGSMAAAGIDASTLDKLAGDMAAANVGVIRDITDPTQKLVVKSAFAWSMRNMFILYTVVSAVSVVASAFIKHETLRTEHEETKTGIENMTKRERSVAAS